MPWITGTKQDGFRVNWREGGRGSPIKHGLTRTTKPEALDDMREMAELLKSRKAPGKSGTLRMPISELITRWQASRLDKKKITKDRADEVKDYFERIIKKAKWQTVSDITADSLDLHGSTKKEIDAVKGVLRWAERILRLPVDRHVFFVETPKVTKRKQTPMLTDEQVADIIATAFLVGGYSVGVAVEHLANYPARPSMIRRLQVQDWDSEHRIITYRAQKNGDDTQHRVHPKHAEKLTLLAKDRQPTDPLFLDPWKRPWGPKNFPSWFAQNIGEHLLPKGSRGTNKLKKWAMTRTKVAAAGNSQLVITMSGHRDVSVIDRHYIEENLPKQDELISKLPYVSSGSTPGSTDSNTWQERERLPGRKRRPIKDRKVLEKTGKGS